MTTTAREARTGSAFSFVLHAAAAEPEVANRHFAAKLSVETDPADVRLDLQRGRGGFRVLDVRSAEAYEQCHIPGALHLSSRAIAPETVAAAGLSRDDVMVVYCWGPGCNGATNAALKLSGLGFRVKEMIGGLEYWRREGHPVEGTLGDDAPLVG